MKKIILFAITVFSLSNIYAQCSLNGASVYIDNNSNPRMINASVNGMSMYSYSWIDTNGLVVGTANQIPFYTQWCVTITDDITGCDTIICQDCTADSNAMCMCIMIYMPVCGCDGVMYSNYCLADCADVPWVPAVPSGQLGGFLPCSTWNPNPSLCEVEIAGDTIICSLGTPQVLTASPTASSNPFVSYVWNNGQSNSAILTITTPGNYCVTATDSTGCTSTACIDISVQDIPIFTNPLPPVVCSGDSIVLEIDTVGLSNITWIPNSLSTPPVHRIVDLPVFSQNYVVEAIDLAGCDRRGEVFVTVVDSTPLNPVTVPNPPIICLGDSIVIEVNQGFVGYWWNTGNPNDTDQDRVVVYPNQDFIYVVEALDSNGCESREEIEVFVDTCATVVTDVSSLKIDIYPNPTNGILYISLPLDVNFSLFIYDITGSNIIYKNNILNEFVLEAGVLEKGIYFVNLSCRNGNITKKLLVH